MSEIEESMSSTKCNNQLSDGDEVAGKYKIILVDRGRHRADASLTDHAHTTCSSVGYEQFGFMWKLMRQKTPKLQVNMKSVEGV